MDDKYLHDVVYRLPKDVVLYSAEMYKILLYRKFRTLYSRIFGVVSILEANIIKHIKENEYHAMDVDVELIKVFINEIIINISFESDSICTYANKLDTTELDTTDKDFKTMLERVKTLKHVLHEIEKHIMEGTLQNAEVKYVFPELKTYMTAYLHEAFDFLNSKFDLKLNEADFRIYVD